MGGSCSTNVGEEEKRLLMGEPEGSRPLGRPKRSWVDNINGFWRGGMGRCGLDWSG
jgi:hypothetical protein